MSTTISTIIPNNDSTIPAGGAHLSSSCNLRPIHTDTEPTTPSTETSSPIAPSDIPASPLSSETPNDSPFAFIAPTESDSRSPCPALNTLANHGYLPRNGRNITRAQLFAALHNPDTYNVSKPLAIVLAYGGFIMMHRLTAHSLSLHDLSQHNLIEHDASVVHKDTTPGHKFAPIRCDTVLLNKLLENDHDVLTLKQVSKRREELERTDPLDLLHQEIARGEWALVLDIFGRENGGDCPHEVLRVWLKQNRFPEGWKPSHEQGLLDTMSVVSHIRDEMKKLQKAVQPSAS